MICFWSIEKKKHQKKVVILGGQNVDIMLVLIRFSEMRVFSQVSFLTIFLRNCEGQKAYMGESHELKTVEILVRN